MSALSRTVSDVSRRLPKPLAENYEWQNKASCIGVDTEVFFLPYNARMADKRRRIVEAKKVCSTCPVIEQCLNHAITVGEEFGVWGGLSEDELRRLRARTKTNVTNKKS